MVTRRRHAAVGWLLAAVGAVAVIGAFGTGGAGATWQAKSYPRAQTLITSGTQWGNIAGMNPYVGNYAAGMIGLVNETLLRFDPLQGQVHQLARQVARSGPARSSTRSSCGPASSGPTASPSRAVTSRSTSTSRRFNTSRWNNLYVNLKQPISRQGQQGRLQLQGNAELRPVAEHDVEHADDQPAFRRRMITTAQELTTYSPRNPIGTGPYKLDTSGYDLTTRVVWVKKCALVGVRPESGSVAGAEVHHRPRQHEQHEQPLGCARGCRGPEQQLPPRCQQARRLRARCRRSSREAPYMLSANTAWLEPNTTKAPLNDPVFRKALAMSINVNQIVTDDYQNLVLKASPTGLLPTWNKYVDNKLVKAYGFKYDPAAVKSMLQKAGYKMDSSGMFANKDGSKIDLDDLRSAGLVRLGGCARHDHRVGEGGRDPHPLGQGPGLQHLAERPEHGQLRPGDRQRLPDQ